MELQMEYMVGNNLGFSKVMNKTSRSRSRSRSRSSSGKVERKIIEKNRRNHMKNLCSTLNSLLPHHNSKEPLAVPDQIDEAVNYIKSLETRLKEFKEKKECLMAMGRKRSYRCTDRGSLKSPEIRINVNSSAMEVVLMTDKDNSYIFYDMIRIFHEQGAQVINASFSLVGNTVFHIVHAEIGAFGAINMLKEKLNKFVHGSSSEQELQLELWDYKIDETWDFSFI